MKPGQLRDELRRLEALVVAARASVLRGRAPRIDFANLPEPTTRLRPAGHELIWAEPSYLTDVNKLSLDQADAIAASDAAGADWKPLRFAILEAGGIRPQPHGTGQYTEFDSSEVPAGLVRRGGNHLSDLGRRIAGRHHSNRFDSIAGEETAAELLERIVRTYAGWQAAQDGLAANGLRLRGARPASWGRRAA